SARRAVPARKLYRQGRRVGPRPPVHAALPERRRRERGEHGARSGSAAGICPPHMVTNDERKHVEGWRRARSASPPSVSVRLASPATAVILRPPLRAATLAPPAR